MFASLHAVAKATYVSSLHIISIFLIFIILHARTFIESYNYPSLAFTNNYMHAYMLHLITTPSAFFILAYILSHCSYHYISFYVVCPSSQISPCWPSPCAPNHLSFPKPFSSSSSPLDWKKHSIEVPSLAVLHQPFMDKF